ncbi:MAG: FMN-binding protein [Paludibacteraceae bacterium]|nr:FMN-binding protein [Paludibacteraceae bacterium]
MAKLESTFKNMVLSLTAITLVAAAGLAAVYMVTKAQIDAQKEAAQNAAKIEVLNGQEGTAIECSADGFGGPIRLMVGFAANGDILGYKVLEHQETPGLGSHIAEWFQEGGKGNIIGMNPGKNNMTVSKDGGEVDAITAATISSRAFLKAIHNAYGQFCEQNGNAVATDSVACYTGASMPKDSAECVMHHCCSEGKEVNHE